MNKKSLSKKIDLGCGKTKRNGYIGVDKLNLDEVDIIHDLNKFPYPFEDNEIDEVWLDQVLEHLEEPYAVIEELYRICRTEAKVFIGVPYFRSHYSIIDPTHKNFFGVYWFNYFDPTHPFYLKYAYSTIKLKVEKIEFDREWKNGNSKISFFHNILIKLAERYPYSYESRLSHLLPLNSLTFHLTILK